MKIFYKIWLFVVNLVAVSTYAQSVYLKSYFVESEKVSIKKFKNQTEVVSYLNNFITSKQQSGFWQSSVDSFMCQNDTCLAYLFVGEKSHLKTKGLDEKTSASNLIFLKNSLEQQMQKLENNGYPFAQILVDTISFSNDSLLVNYKIDSGSLVLIDSFVNHENAKISKNFIQNYIGIKSGKLYNEKKIASIDALLNKLPYTEMTQPTKINFREDKADIHLYLKKRKVNKFDFIIGFLPNNSITKKIMITGEARIHLQNAFKRGEELFFEWTRLHPNSQRLAIRFAYPFLLKTQLGISTDFLLEKRDSTSLDLKLNFGLPYYFKTNNYFKGFYKYAQTIILQIDTNYVKSFRNLPSNLDATYHQYGLEFYFETIDYFPNPRIGLEFLWSTSIGTRKLKRNNQIITLSSSDNFDFNKLYDSTKLKSLKADLFWKFNYYLPFGKRNTLKFSQQGGSIFNSNLLKNELLRIGGNKLLRGFDEESIYASTYIFGSIEYRLLLQKNAYMSVFYDFAYARTKFESKVDNNFPFGFGVGINFESKIGIFGLSYALGQQKHQPISFRNSKIHFGYVALF